MKLNYLPAWAAGFVLSVFALSSCDNEMQQTKPAQQQIVHSDSSSIVKQGTFRGIPITYKETHGKAIMEGDILLSKEDLASVTSTDENNNARTDGAGLANKNYRWQNWTIPYQFDNQISQFEIMQTFKYIENVTPLRFVARTNEKDYIRFVKSATENSSYVGRIGGMQVLNLYNDKSSDVIIHELGHAIGMFHEHNRRDRDNYINIHWDNIKPEVRDQYNRWPIGQGFDYGSFDYSSVMMYEMQDNTLNGNATITRKDGQFYLPGNSFSPDDVRTIISMYSNLYIVKAGELFAVNPKDGKSATLGTGWNGSAKTLAENDDHIWGIQGGGLWKTFRFNGGYERVGNDDWTGATGLTGQDAQGNFYAVYQNKLYKINKYGQRSVLGPNNWDNVQALYYHNNSLYIAWSYNQLLSRVNTTTGLIEKHYDAIGWKDVRGIAAVQASSENLYVLRKDAMYRVNTVTGVVAGGEKFLDVKAMTGAAGYLFIVKGSTLIKMDEYSNKVTLSGGWGATESIGSIRNPKLID